MLKPARRLKNSRKHISLLGDFTAAVLSISEPRFRTRVTSYGNYGRSRTKSGEIEDIRGSLASFMSNDLEDLLCGRRPDRYVASPSLGNRYNQKELVLRALKSVAVNARKLANRGHGRPAIEVSSEYDVQDLAGDDLGQRWPRHLQLRSRTRTRPTACHLATHRNSRHLHPATRPITGERCH